MAILDFTKPVKIASTSDWNASHSSDSGVAGTYVPNMSTKDRNKWKAKHIKGTDNRIEIRKSIIGNGCGTQMLVIVRKDKTQLSANGTMVFDNAVWKELFEAVEEAKALL